MVLFPCLMILTTAVSIILSAPVLEKRSIPNNCQSVGTTAAGGSLTCLSRGEKIQPCSYMKAGPTYLTMQADGNLVAYSGDPTNMLPDSTPIWQTGTVQATSSVINKYYFEYQTDGNFLITSDTLGPLVGGFAGWYTAAKESSGLCLRQDGGLVLVKEGVVTAIVVDVNSLPSVL
ncbi:hypothetical protein HDU79_004268 [Rhizoclosmatium sp. JEL0117]|nr:hypothetical protein HDU79_004268 [Rhizoclosmatium sp. JEL0117]